MGVTGNELLLQLHLWHIRINLNPNILLWNTKRKEQLNEHKVLCECQKINGKPRINPTKM